MTTRIALTVPIVLVSGLVLAAIVFIAPDHITAPPLTPSSATSNNKYTSPSGTAYPARYTPQNVRSKMYIWELDGAKLEDMDEDVQTRAQLDTKWERDTSFMSLALPPDELVYRWRQNVHDPHNVLDENEKQRFLTHIAEHAIARSMPTPMRYQQLVESDPHLEWNTDLSDVAKIRIFYDFFLERPADYSAPTQSILAEVWNGLREHDHLYDEVGYGPNGAIFIAKRIRSASLLRTMFHGPDAPEDSTNWMTSAASAPMRFTNPTLHIEDAITQHGSVVVLHARIVTRLRDGRLGIWDPTWYVDPETNELVVVSMGSRTVTTFMTVM